LKDSKNYFDISFLLEQQNYQVGLLSTLYFIDGIGPFGGTFYLQEAPVSGSIPPVFQSVSNVVGINWATANQTGSGWSFNYVVNVQEAKDLLVIDETASALFLALLGAAVGFVTLIFF